MIRKDHPCESRAKITQTALDYARVMQGYARGVLADHKI